jgi:hypothetical protein
MHARIRRFQVFCSRSWVLFVELVSEGQSRKVERPTMDAWLVFVKLASMSIMYLGISRSDLSIYRWLECHAPGIVMDSDYRHRRTNGKLLRRYDAILAFWWKQCFNQRARTALDDDYLDHQCRSRENISCAQREHHTSHRHFKPSQDEM